MNIYEAKQDELMKWVVDMVEENIDNAKIGNSCNKWTHYPQGHWINLRVGNIRLYVHVEISHAMYMGEVMAGPFYEGEIKIKQGLLGKELKFQNVVPWEKKGWVTLKRHDEIETLCKLMYDKHTKRGGRTSEDDLAIRVADQSVKWNNGP